MQGRELVREILVSTWAIKVSAAMTAIIAMIMCLASLLTVGRSSAADDQLAARLDEAGTRSFSIVDVQSNDYLGQTVRDAISALSTVEHAYGFSIASDVINANIGEGGPVAPARVFSGDLREAVRLVEGRWPVEGEALVDSQAQQALGMDKPYGAVTFLDSESQANVVGRYEPMVTIDGLSSVLVVDSDVTPQVMQVIVDHYNNLDAVMSEANAIIGAKDPQLLRIQPPVSITELANSVAGDLTDYSTSVLYGVLGVGGLVCAVVVLTDALTRRSDLGRRMALGATRGTIVAYTVGRTLVPAFAGAVIGCLVGLAVTAKMGFTAPLDFTAGVGILTILVMGFSAIPASLWAANQDPVTVLRTP